MAFEDQYYLLFPSFTPGVVILSPDEHTASRPYLSRPLVPGKPLRFSNGFADRLPSPDAERIDDLLSDATTFGVSERVRERLERFDIEGVQFYPMIFVDARGHDHPGYYYVNVYREQPFLDRSAATVMPGSEDEDDEEDDDILLSTYAFDAEAMAGVSEENRLIFILKGVDNANFIVHQRVLDELVALGATGYRPFRVSEFREGMQH